MSRQIHYLKLQGPNLKSNNLATCTLALHLMQIAGYQPGNNLILALSAPGALFAYPGNYVNNSVQT